MISLGRRLLWAKRFISLSWAGSGRGWKILLTLRPTICNQSLMVEVLRFTTFFRWPKINGHNYWRQTEQHLILSLYYYLNQHNTKNGSMFVFTLFFHEIFDILFFCNNDMILTPACTSFIVDIFLYTFRFDLYSK